MDNPADSQSSGARPDHLRSRVTNGKELLPGVDGRTLWIRRLRDVMHAHATDLGGLDACSEAERSVIRRIGTLTVAIEQLEARFANEGGGSDRALEMHQRMAGNLRRLLEAIGMQRRTRDITPTLDQYINAKADT